ncbi:gas vesicle protein [Streptomyces sp. L2]|uniref:gas vesicle protein GvpO n=1 Tax=Streptomyces sp. L2 TaxID=2162665 RepID=UPI001013B6AA|nr:gas vesicle protein [Streptomyces sp. L2]
MSNTRSTSQSQSSQKPQKTQSSRDAHESRNSQENKTSSDSSNSPDSAERETDEQEPAPIDILRQARAQLAELTGLVPESVTAFERSEDGWSLEVEVLELARVPDTMSLMASYQLDLDARGRLTGYRRVRRYERARADARRPGGR